MNVLVMVTEEWKKDFFSPGNYKRNVLGTRDFTLCGVEL